MARWGIAEDGEVVALTGPEALVDEVVRLVSPPAGLAWAGEPPARVPACSIDLVLRARRGVGSGVGRGDDAAGRDAASGDDAVLGGLDRDSDGLIGSPIVSPIVSERVMGRIVGRTADRGAVLEVRVDGVLRPGGDAAVESALGLFAAEHLRELVAVHSAVLLMGGAAVLVPGASFSGKSSLCAAALNAGVEVWGDEFALLHRDGQVSGWPRPIRLRTRSGVVRRPLDGGIDGGTPTPVPARVALVAAVAYSSAGWSVTRASAADVVTDLLANAVPAARRPAASFGSAVAVSQHAAGVRGTRGEAADAVERLLDLVAQAA